MNLPSPPAPQDCLAPSATVESAHPEVVAFARAHGRGGDDRERAIALYYAVRDGIRYDAYAIELTPAGLSASQALTWGRGWCVSKAVLLAACCRALGIPAALGFADVRNHLSTERMRRTMKTDVFIWHGYTTIWLDGAWRKATPAFNRELCEKFRIHTLEFDGREDSIYQPFDLEGRQHMEYLAYRGEYIDLPIARMTADFRQFYPQLAEMEGSAEFDREVEAETRVPD